MSSYIYIKNFYLEEIQEIVQEQINSNYSEESKIEAEILMKNSRTYFIRFNEELAIEEILDWMKTFFQNNPENERTTTIEGYLTMNQVEYKFYFSDENVYGINSDNKAFQVEDFEELIPIESPTLTLTKTEIPTKNIHSMGIIKTFVPKKKWWKFWS